MKTKDKEEILSGTCSTCLFSSRKRPSEHEMRSNRRIAYSEFDYYFLCTRRAPAQTDQEGYGVFPRVKEESSCGEFVRSPEGTEWLPPYTGRIEDEPLPPRNVALDKLREARRG